MSRIDPGDNDLNWWRWVNDDWLVVGVGAEVLVDARNWYASRALGVRSSGGATVQLGWKDAGQKADDLIWVARDGTPQIAIAMQRSISADDDDFWPVVEQFDVSTGKGRTIVPSRDFVRNWYADAAGTVRMGVSYNDGSRKMRLYYRQGGNEDFKQIATADARVNDSLRQPALFLADPSLALAYDDSDGFDVLRLLELPGLKFGEPVFSVRGYDVAGIISDAAGTGLAGVSYIDTRYRVHWFDAGMGKLQDVLEKSVGPGRHARIISMDKAYQTFIVEVNSPSQPSAFYTLNLADGALRMLAKNSPTLPNGALSPVKSIRYKARDGLEIEAVLTLPKGTAVQNLPLILMPHGGPFARDQEEWDWIVQFLANRGYAVLQPNYRGSSGYGTAFATKGEGQWGLGMQDDLNDGVDALVKLGVADPKRVCIVGASYGGYAAMRGAQRDGARYRCAVSYAGVSDLGVMTRYDKRFLDSGGGIDWLKQQAPDFRAISPIGFAGAFSTPILLMHGKKDRRVPVGQSRSMAERLKIAGKAYRYVEQPLGDHFFSREEDRVQFLKEMEAFLAQYNPA